MNKFNKWLSGIGLGLFALGLTIFPSISKAADFDATDTQSMLTTSLNGVTPTLKYGIGAILLVGLSIWAIFFIVGKLKKHVK